FGKLACAKVGDCGVVQGDRAHLWVGGSLLEFLSTFRVPADLDKRPAILGPCHRVVRVGLEPLAASLNDFLVLEAHVDGEIGKYLQRVKQKIDVPVRTHYLETGQTPERGFRHQRCDRERQLQRQEQTLRIPPVEKLK